MLASSSKTFGTSFKAFEGGIADIQSTLNEFVNARANIAKLQEEETKKIKDSLDAHKAAKKQLEKMDAELADLDTKLRAASASTAANAQANIDAINKQIESKEAEVKATKDKIKEEEKYRKTARSENKKREALIAELDATVDNVSKFSAEILDSKKAVNMWGKELDKSKQRLKDWAATTLTLTGGFALLKAGALELADKYRLVADVGMAGSMTQFSKTALSLNLTMTQLSKIVAENRAAFAKSGLSISQFDSIVKGNAKSLQEIGLSYEQSAATQAKMVGGAVAALGAEQKNNSALITKSVNDQVKAFKVLSVATGETTEALASEYEALLKDQDIAKKLQSLKGKERNDAAAKLMVDYQHYKLLGLTNDQIKEAINLKTANNFKLSDRVSGAAQLSNQAKLVGMNPEEAAKIFQLVQKRNRTDTEQADLDKLLSRMNNLQNDIVQNGKDGAQREVVMQNGDAIKNNPLVAKMLDHAQALNTAQSNGSAQMSIADANKQLIAANAAGTDKMVEAYSNGVVQQSKLISRLMEQAKPSNDAMAKTGQTVENAKAFADAVKDTPFWSAGKMLLGAGIMLLAAAKMMMKSNGSMLDNITDMFSKGKKGSIARRGVGRMASRTATKMFGKTGGKAIKGAAKMGGKLLKGLPIIGSLASLAFNAKDIYDATQEADPKTKTEKLTTSISSTVGTILGGAIGAAFGGPLGAMVGAILGDFVGGWVGDIINWVRDNYSKNPYVKAAVDFISKWTPFGWVVNGAIWIWNNATKIWDTIKKIANETWFLIKNFTPFGWVYQGVAAIVKHWDDICEWVSKTVDNVIDSVTKNPVFKFISDIVGWYVDQWKSIYKTVKGWIDPVINAVSDWHPFDWLGDMFESLVDGYYTVKKKFLEAKDYVGLTDDEDKKILADLEKRAKEKEAAKNAPKAVNAAVATATAATPSGAAKATTGLTKVPFSSGNSTTPAKPAAMLPIKTSTPSQPAGYTPTGGTPAGSEKAAPKGDEYLNSIIQWGGGVSGDLAHFKKMDPGLQQRVVAYAEAYYKATNGKKLRINSAYRSQEEQNAVAGQNAEKGIINAATGTSPHSRGIAIDINPSSIDAAYSAGVKMESFGLWRPLKGVKNEAQHVQPAGTAANNSQAKSLGIMSPAQAQATTFPGGAAIPSATNNVGSSPSSSPSSTGGSTGGSGGYTPAGGPPSTSPGSTASVGGGDVIALLKKIAGLNTEQLMELKNIVSATKSTKMISEKDQLKTV
jgi:hypothetical protein